MRPQPQPPSLNLCTCRHSDATPYAYTPPLAQGGAQLFKLVRPLSDRDIDRGGENLEVVPSFLPGVTHGGTRIPHRRALRMLCIWPTSTYWLYSR